MDACVCACFGVQKLPGGPFRRRLFSCHGKHCFFIFILAMDLATWSFVGGHSNIQISHTCTLRNEKTMFELHCVLYWTAVPAAERDTVHAISTTLRLISCPSSRSRRPYHHTTYSTPPTQLYSQSSPPQPDPESHHHRHHPRLHCPFLSSQHPRRHRLHRVSSACSGTTRRVCGARRGSRGRVG